MANGGYRRQVAAGRIPPTLPPTVEEAYRKKCIELKRRMTEVEQNNDTVRLRKTRLLRGIRKMRLERSLLLHELGKRMRKNGTNGYWDEDSEGSSESPPTPHEKPLRSKRSHRRVALTPPPLAHQLSGSNGAMPQHQLAYHRNAYQTSRDFPFDTMQDPNPHSHLPAAPSYQPDYALQQLYPTRQSQVPYGTNSYEYYMRVQYIGQFRGPLASLPQEDQLILQDNAANGTSKWLREFGDRDWEYWATQFHQNLGRWRAQMDSHARETGEQPRGSLRPHGYDWEQDRDDSMLAAQHCEQRGLDFVFGVQEAVQVDDGAAANGGFTAVNNLKQERV